MDINETRQNSIKQPILDYMLQSNVPLEYILKKVKHLPVIIDEYENFLLNNPFVTFDKKNYGLILARSLRAYLAEGLDFQNMDQISAYYKYEVVVENPFEHGVPWQVGLLQSIHHLQTDTPQRQLKTDIKRQNKTALLVSLYNETKFSELCFKALRKFTHFPSSIFAVNNSTIDMSDFKLQLVRNKLIDFWFDSGFHTHTEGLQAVLPRVQEYKYVCTIDSDAIVLKDDWLNDLITKMQNENAGLIGPPSYGLVNKSKIIKSWGIHPACMVIDLDKIAGKFQIDFCNQWPWDVAHLITWDCLANNVPVVRVKNEIFKDYARGYCTINDSVRHLWFTSRILNLSDDQRIDNVPVVEIREKLDDSYNSPEFRQVKEFIVT